jgi:hypothetical protein
MRKERRAGTGVDAAVQQGNAEVGIDTRDIEVGK